MGPIFDYYCDAFVIRATYSFEQLFSERLEGREVTKVLVRAVANVAREVTLFFIRYKSVFLCYGVMSLWMKRSGTGVGFRAMALVPGLVWTLFHVEKTTSSDYIQWFHQQKGPRVLHTYEGDGTSLLERNKLFTEIVDCISNAQTVSHSFPRFLILAPTGMGKSAFLQLLAEKLVKKEIPVALLRTEIFASGTQPEKNLPAIQHGLKAIERARGQKIVLLIDQMDTINAKLFNDQAGFSTSLIIVGAAEQINDESVQRRFNGHIHTLPVWDQKSICTILKKSFSNISDEVIATAVEETKERGAEHSWFSRAQTVLEETSLTTVCEVKEKVKQMGWSLNGLSAPS